ncbi:MAG TPA: UDP-3-O-(3-hydroxymyristoyl)glucosamine N-acyltransferase [Gemmataceae bacterium]|nr:UDP-3-O-(3-hydroxymyristoyl)glucosamine N-acyltransferase [Gemmataceae bacterium]
MQVTVTQLASLVQGRVHGDERSIGAARPMNEAGPDDITFIESDRNVRHLKTCRARTAIVPASLVARRQELLGTDGTPLTLIEVNDPLTAFVTIVRHLHGEPVQPPTGIDPRAAIHPTAQIGSEATLHPFAVVGEGSILGARCRLHSGAVIGRNCRLGDDVVLHPHVVLYEGTILGDRVIIHANAVLGADGFGYRMQGGRHIKMPQFGTVEIGDDVEIGAGTTIDRGTFQATRIGAGTKIDNLVQIGHNCQIGKHNLFVSQVGIAGSCSTGDYVVLAGQVGVADHVHIEDRAIIGAKSGVVRDVPAGERMLGAPAKPEGEEKRILLSLSRLPELCRDVRRVKHQLGLDKGAA